MTPAKQLVEVAAPLPDSLLYHPCDVVGAGNTVQSLAKAYVINTNCVGEYSIVVDKIIKYNEELKNARKQVRDKQQ